MNAIYKIVVNRKRNFISIKRGLQARVISAGTHPLMNPEILAIPEKSLKEWISAPEFKDYKIYVEKLMHFNSYTLSEKEERILSLQAQPAETAYNAFSVLENVDLNRQFGSVNVNGEEKPLTQTTFTTLLKNQDRKIRETTYRQFYKKFEDFQNVISAL